LLCELIVGDLPLLPKRKVYILFFNRKYEPKKKNPFPKKCIRTLFVWISLSVKCIYVKIVRVLEGHGRLSAVVTEDHLICGVYMWILIVINYAQSENPRLLLGPCLLGHWERNPIVRKNTTHKESP
jgi:hypothetical protein